MKMKVIAFFLVLSLSASSQELGLDLDQQTSLVPQKIAAGLAGSTVAVTGVLLGRAEMLKAKQALRSVNVSGEVSRIFGDKIFSYEQKIQNTRTALENINREIQVSRSALQDASYHEGARLQYQKEIDFLERRRTVVVEKLDDLKHFKDRLVSREKTLSKNVRAHGFNALKRIEAPSDLEAKVINNLVSQRKKHILGAGMKYGAAAIVVAATTYALIFTPDFKELVDVSWFSEDDSDSLSLNFDLLGDGYGFIDEKNHVQAPQKKERIIFQTNK